MGTTGVSPAGSLRAGHGGDFAELARLVRRAGLLRRRYGYYAARIGPVLLWLRQGAKCWRVGPVCRRMRDG
ncbi:hypothetical protein GCM10012275_50840 [Longimycelium tulufanense]|uniref:Uncharacterized protein n=1 Tax=Longimycelium tulufanense TaxID=907463 RepID=A0A8J3FW46_9PSEU|nr:hypothetical protein [Longimycelium tulufanense]GGM73946.1 hypothetical protein GCM10012275_50840 [Longimycelium tulufanense]